MATPGFILSMAQQQTPSDVLEDRNVPESGSPFAAAPVASRAPEDQPDYVAPDLDAGHHPETQEAS